MTAAAIAGSFADAKIVKTRSTLQLIIELPIEQADAALKALGGVPQPGREKPVAVALLDTDAITSGPLAAPPAAPTHPPEEIHQAPAKQRQVGAATVAERAMRRCGILCGDREFQSWLRDKKLSQWPYDRERSLEEWTVWAVRSLLGVSSRREMATSIRAREVWLMLEDEFMRHSKRRPPLAGEAA